MKGFCLPTKTDALTTATHRLSFHVPISSRFGRALVAGCGFASWIGFAASPSITEQPESKTIFVGDQVTFKIAASGTEPLQYQWFRNGEALSNQTSSDLVFATAAADHEARFTVQITNYSGVVTSVPAVLEIDFGMPGPATTNRLIEVTTPWRYNVSKSDLGTNWKALDYSDAGWLEGPGLLYVEDSVLPASKSTALPVSPGDLPMTCYFRTQFTNHIAEAFSNRLILHTLIDDGVVFHLNGGEALRLGMPQGELSYGTAAERTVGNAEWEGPIELPSTNLAPGINVVAGEVHQVNSSSTDIVFGLALDQVWQARFRDSNAPVASQVLPAAGETVPALTSLQVQFSEPVRNVDATDLRINGQPAVHLTVIAPDRYLFECPPVSKGSVSVTWAEAHGIVDRSANSNAFAGTGFGYRVGEGSPAARLPFNLVRQSSDAAPDRIATRAVDNSSFSFALTQDLPGSYWLGELSRRHRVERLELVNRPEPGAAEMGGVVVRLYDIDDQVVFESAVTNPGPSATAVFELPEGLEARSVWIGLSGEETNEAGNHRVGLAEVRLYGSADIPFGPPPHSAVTVTNAVRVWQSSEYGGFPASYGNDGDPENFTHTDDLPNSYWMADLGKAVPISRVEIVNRSSCCADRLSGLVLRIFDASSNSVHATVLPNPGLGETWIYTPPAGTLGRWVRVGLEDGQMNGGGNYYVTIAEARVFSGVTNVLAASANLPVPVIPNLASFKRSYMLRLDESVPPASRANDDNYSTETRTTLRTVDGYWEVDLGATYALYGVRAIGASGMGFRLTNAVVRLYDAEHDSVYAAHLTGTPDVFDLDLNGPVFARYVRVGLEDKTRTDPAGGIEFYIGFREVEVFGQPTNNVGIGSFNASSDQLSPGQSTALSWNVDEVRRLEVRPSIGSVGAHTAISGAGSLNVTPLDSTELILIASNTVGVFTRAVGVQVGSSPLSVRISEIVADNQYSLKDGYGNAPDWIELRNTGNAPVNLGGWGLSDEPGQPGKWTFPEASLAPHSTLIVFASGRNESLDPGGNLHANFRLGKSGGNVILTAKDGVTRVDALIGYPEQDTDLAYGRNLDGHWTFLEPTPGAFNVAPTYEGWLKPLQWSHERGFYEEGFTLTLTNPNPGGSVLYSLDGSAPEQSYAAGLPITSTAVVRAVASRPGYRPARVQTMTYLFVDEVIRSPVMDRAITLNAAYASRMRPGLMALPSISISVPGQPEYEEKEGSVEILWPQGGDHVQVNCGVSRFGNAWTKFAKRNFRIKCRSQYGAAKLEAPLFDGFDGGFPARSSFDELDLRSGSQDMVERGFYMAGRFVEDTMLEMGSLNPHGRFVHVYLNGVYWGQYDCREMLVDHFLADYLGGTEDDYVVVRGNDNVGDDFVIGTPDPPNLEPWEAALSMRNSYERVRSSVDVRHLIDFMLLWNYGDCESEYRSCGPLHAGSGFKFWIADADGFLRTSALGLNRTDRTGPGGLFGGLVAENHSDFKALLADRIYLHFHNEGALTPSANRARLDRRMQEIRDSLLAECARWGYRTPANWEAAAASIRSTLFPARTGELLRYLRNRGLYPAFEPPAFNQYGGLVTNGFQPALSSSSGTIYYTLDGSDPRLSGGGISPKARTWSAGAVTIAGDTTIHARVRASNGQWSALAQPRFLVGSRRAPTARDLLLTEIHYNPPGDDEFEFIELYNASRDTLELSGVSLSGGVRFVFPEGHVMAPGEFRIVVEDAASFSSRYETAGSPYYYPNLIVAGEWTGALDNAGETVSLVSSNGLQLASITYSPGGDWPDRADGGGSSLELRGLPPVTATEAEAAAFLASARNWTASSIYQGSPGRLHSVALTVSAWIEAGLVRLEFQTIPGETYRAEWCGDLAVPDWRTLQEPMVAQGDSLTLLDPAPIQNGNRYYRVVRTR